MVDSGIVPILLESLREDTRMEMLEHHVMTLGNLASQREIADLIANLGGCERIAALCPTLNEELQVCLSKLVANLSCSELPRSLFLHTQVPALMQARSESSNQNLAIRSRMAAQNLRVPVQNPNRRQSVPADKVEKFYTKRINIVREILDTERTYCQQLNQCVNVYMRPLQALSSEGKPLLSSSAIKDIFSAIEIIANMHNLFLEDLESGVQTNQEQEGPAEMYVGEAFLRLIDCLRLYRTYISEYDRSVNALSDALEKPRFQEWLERQNITHCTPSLANILITPIQRIPRYVLLLQDLLKHMAVDHPDYHNLEQALQGVLQVADYLDHERGKAENTNKVIEVQEQVNGAPIKLVHPSRSFIASGDIIEEGDRDRKSQKLKMRHFFLFNDLLLITSPKRKRFSYRAYLKLEDTKVIAFPREERPTSLRIVTPQLADGGTTYTCSTVQERDQWVDRLNTAIFEHKKNDYTRRVASQRLSETKLNH